MKYTEPPRTVFKLIAKRQTRQLFQLGAVIFSLLLVVAGIAGVQALFCKQEHPDRTVLRCVAPLFKLRDK